MTAYGVLSRGLLTGSPVTGPSDLRGHLPRFVGANLERNRVLIEELGRLAAERRVTPAQLATAWVLAKGETIIPLIGARRRAQLTESLAALALPLTPADIARIEARIPPDAAAGTRYARAQMAMLDSEKP